MTRNAVILLASMLVTLVLGSVHAFSVFILPLETRLLLPRSDISLIYSFTLVSITISVLFGYRVYARLPAWLLVALACFTAGLGVFLASRASEWWQLFLGYSVMFGISNGIGYGFCLQLVGRVMPQIKGFAMGAVTAAYAVGSVIFVKIFAIQIANQSLAAALMALLVGLVICGVVSAICLHVTGAQYGETAEMDVQTVERRKVVQFWMAYMTSVFAGLMAIGHAAGVVISAGGNTELATTGAITIGVGSASGGFIAGWLVDRWPARRFLIGLPLLAGFALFSIALTSTPVVAVAILSLLGFSYGSLIAIYPVAISDYFGTQGPRVYGQVFTAWGFAGLMAPWLAGILFDIHQNYQFALIIAALVALASASLVFFSRLEPEE